MRQKIVNIILKGSNRVNFVADIYWTVSWKNLTGKDRGTKGEIMIKSAKAKSEIGNPSWNAATTNQKWLTPLLGIFKQ